MKISYCMIEQFLQWTCWLCKFVLTLEKAIGSLANWKVKTITAQLFKFQLALYIHCLWRYMFCRTCPDRPSVYSVQNFCSLWVTCNRFEYIHRMSIAGQRSVISSRVKVKGDLHLCVVCWSSQPISQLSWLLSWRYPVCRMGSASAGARRTYHSCIPHSIAERQWLLSLHPFKIWKKASKKN